MSAISPIEGPTLTFYDVAMEYERAEINKPVAVVSEELCAKLSKVVKLVQNDGNHIVFIVMCNKKYHLQKRHKFMAAMTRMWCTCAGGSKLKFSTVIESRPDAFLHAALVFNPTGAIHSSHVNMFMGFQATKLETINTSKIQLLLNHLRDVWARGDLVIYNYILDWFANIVKGTKNKTALVLSPNHGGVKNIVTDFIRRAVIGIRYTIDCYELKRVTDKTDKNYVLTVINRAKAQDCKKLKTLITNTMTKIATKTVKGFEAASYNNFIITLETPRQFKTMVADEQFTLIELDSSKCEDREYCDKLSAELAICADDFITFLYEREITTCVELRREHTTGHARSINTKILKEENSQKKDPTNSVSDENSIAPHFDTADLTNNSPYLYILEVEPTYYKYGISEHIHDRLKTHKRDINFLRVVQIYSCTTAAIMRETEKQLGRLATKSGERARKYNKTEIIRTDNIKKYLEAIPGLITG